LKWLINLGYDYIVYDKTHSGGVGDNKGSFDVPKSNLEKYINKKKIINSSNNGYNIYDFLKFIIDNYNKLPNRIAFIKGNIVGRHISKNFFLNSLNNDGFVELFDRKSNQINSSILNASALITLDNFFLEVNNNYFFHHRNHPKKYFYSTMHFLKFCFVDTFFSLYLKFPPGGCFITNKKNILFYPKNFYVNLLTFVSHHRVPAEGLLLERLLPTILQNNFLLNNKIKKKLSKKDLSELEKKVERRNNFLFIFFRKNISILTKIIGFIFVKFNIILSLL